MDPLLVEKFRETLRDEGLKFTPQRHEILKLIFSTPAHMDVEEMLMKCRNMNISVSRATLYRTMDLLVKAGFVNKLDFGDGISRYERISGIPHHDHLVCTECGGIEEFQNKEIENLQNQVCRSYGFYPTSHKLVIYGLCKRCSAEQSQ